MELGLTNFVSMNKHAPPRWYLREWRKHRKLSQEKLGSMVGWSQGMISQLETGEVKFIEDHLPILAAALNCTVKQLLFYPPGMEDFSVLMEQLSKQDRERVKDIIESFKRTAAY